MNSQRQTLWHHIKHILFREFIHISFSLSRWNVINSISIADAPLQTPFTLHTTLSQSNDNCSKQFICLLKLIYKHKMLVLGYTPNESHYYLIPHTMRCLTYICAEKRVLSHCNEYRFPLYGCRFITLYTMAARTFCLRSNKFGLKMG